MEVVNYSILCCIIIYVDFKESLTNIDEVVRTAAIHYFSLQHTVLIPHASQLLSLRESAKSYQVQYIKGTFLKYEICV